MCEAEGYIHIFLFITNRHDSKSQIYSLYRKGFSISNVARRYVKAAM